MLCQSYVHTADLTIHAVLVTFRIKQSASLCKIIYIYIIILIIDSQHAFNLSFTNRTTLQRVHVFVYGWWPTAL